MTEKRYTPGALLHSRYRVVSVLGAGGVSTVYRAMDEQLGREVALKVIAHPAAGSAELRRVEDEVRLLAGFSHPALVTLFDVLSGDGDESILVMQFVDGEDLSARIARGAIAREKVAAIGAAIAEALAFVHESGVIHRDVKPANILLPAAGPQPALLADFGIARLVDSAAITAVGTIIGTASYLSPEQARGAALSDRSDIYSLGLVLLEALTGIRAFPGSAVESVAARLSSDPAIPRDLGPDWVGLLSRMVASEPEARPSSPEVQSTLAALDAPTATLVMPAALAPTEALEPAAATERLVPAATAALPAPAVSHRTRRGVAVIAALAGILVVASVTFAVSRFGETPAPDPTSPTSAAAAATSSPAGPLPPLTYPTVDGELGERLEALQSAVATLDDDAVARELGLQVLAVSEAAAANDFEGSRSTLDTLAIAIDDAQLSTADRQAITEASEALRQQLESLIKQSDKPGTGKPDKPDKKP